MTARTLLRFVALYSLSAVPSQAGDDPRFNPVGNPGFAIADWQSKDKPPIIISVDGSPTIGTQDTKDAPDGGGALIGEVLPDTPAFKAGLKVGDRITVWKGQPVRTRQDWITLLEAGKTGDEVEFTYVRAGQPITAKASLTVRKGESSAPWEAGLRPGDVILSFGGQATPTAYDYSQIKEAYAAGESVEVRYRRGTEEHSTQLKLDFYEGEKDGTAAFKLTPGGGHGSPIQDMLVSPARREAVSYDNDGVFIIWGVDDMKPKKRFILPSGFGSVKRASLARDGRMLGLICAYGVKRSAFVVDLDRLDIAAYLPIPENRNDMRFEEIAIAPDSSTALCVQNLWDEKTLPLGETRLFLFDLEGAGLLKESAPCGVKPPVFIGGLRVFASPGTGTNPVYQGQAGLAALGVSDGTIHQWTLTRSASLQLDTKDSRLFNYRTDLPAIRKQASTLKPEDVIAPKNHPWRNVIKCWLQPLTLASSETGNLLAFCGKNYHTSVLRLTPDLKATHSWHRSALEGGYDLGEEAWFKMGVARYSQLNRQVRHVTLDGMGWVDSSTYHQIKPRNSVRQQRQIDFKDPDSVSDSTECPWRIISFPGSALAAC